MNDSALSYCEATVRTHDRDRYLLVLAAKKGGVVDLYPLFAFNHELAKTAEVVTEPQLGLIRLQWWREALETHYNGKEVPKHEILDALIPVIKAHDLPQSLFEELLEAREKDFDPSGLQAMHELVSYVEGTVAPLNKLAMMILGEKEDASTVRDLSVVYGLQGILRAQPYVSPGSGKSLGENIKTEAVVTYAQGLLDGIKPESRYLCAARRLSSIYLKRIEKNKFNISDRGISMPPVGFMIRIFLGLA